MRETGLALLDARRSRRSHAQRCGVGADRARRDGPHRVVPTWSGRPGRAVDRRPPRTRPYPPRGDAGQAGRRPGQYLEHPLPGTRRLHRRGAALRAQVHRAGRPHRQPGPDPRRDRKGGAARARRTAPRHAAAPRCDLRRHRGERGGVLRPPRPGRRAGPGPIQHPEPRAGHRVLGLAARRHRQGRDSGVVRRRQARRRPVLAQAHPAVGQPGCSQSRT